jgi:transposase
LGDILKKSENKQEEKQEENQTRKRKPGGQPGHRGKRRKVFGGVDTIDLR